MLIKDQGGFTSVNGYYKAEIVYGPTHPGPWKTVEEVELATLGWVCWHNTERLHGYRGDVPPTEFEATFYARQRTDQEPAPSPFVSCGSCTGGRR